ELQQTFAGEAPKFQRPMDIEVHGVAGKPLTLIARDELGNIARVESAISLVVAEKQPLTTERLRDQLGRLGGTPFKLGELQNQITGEVLLPISELNRLRREVVSELERLRMQPRRWTLLEQNSKFQIPSSSSEDCAPELIVLVRDLAQLEAALRCGVQTV